MALPLFAARHRLYGARSAWRREGSALLYGVALRRLNINLERAIDTRAPPHRTPVQNCLQRVSLAPRMYVKPQT